MSRQQNKKLTSTWTNLVKFTFALSLIQAFLSLELLVLSIYQNLLLTPPEFVSVAIFVNYVLFLILLPIQIISFAYYYFAIRTTNIRLNKPLFWVLIASFVFLVSYLINAFVFWG
jgi:hypothetical protein